MSISEATFEVQEVYNITGRTDTYVAGKIREGFVRAGMHAKVLVDGRCSFVRPMFYYVIVPGGGALPGAVPHLGRSRKN